MDVLKKVIFKDLVLNKKRTIVTIIGIILSTALICAVAGMVTSVQKTLIEYTKEKNGNYHATFMSVPKEETKYIENNVNIDNYYLSEELGYSKLDNSKNEYKPYLSILAANDGYLENMGLKLIKGRLPKNSNELVICEHIIKNGEIEYQVGDEVNLDICRRMSNGYELFQSNPYDDTVKEKLEHKYIQKYTIVGIIERLDYNREPYEAPGYTVITKMDDIKEKANVSVLYKNVFKYKENNEDLNPNDKYSVEFNDSLLDYEGAGLSNTTMTTVLTLAGIVMGIIIVSSVFVIRNSFAISITERMRQYGMLASVGATSKQIKKSVFFEALLIGIIAIPLGIISAIIAIVVLLWLVNLILSDQLAGVHFIYCVPWLPIIISIILSSITIHLSARSSARKASNVSPMELIRSNQDIQIKAKKVKSPKFINKLFGIGGDISYKNLKRNRKKYRTTIISIIVSIVIFISLSSFIEYAFKTSGVYYKELSYNLQLYLYSNNASESNKKYEIFDKVSKLDNIDSFSIVKEKSMTLSNYKKYLSEKVKQYIDLYYDNGDAEKFSIEVVAVGSQEYERYVKSLGGKVEEFSKGGILINDFMTYDEDGKPVLADRYNIKVGETINGGFDSETKKDINIKIVDITDKRPMGLENTYTDGGFLIVSDEFFNTIPYNKNADDTSKMYIQSSNASKTEEEITKLISDRADSSNWDYHITNYEEEAKANKSMVLVVSIFLYGFITVIILIGITNIFNTLTTTMDLRRKEFAMLKSVGMTRKEFNRMIRLESIFYGLKALIIGLPIGIGISFIIYKAFLNSLDMSYVLPIKSIIISIVFVFIVVGIIMKFSLSKINKQNIIETIREENV